jgi:tRNA A-37 threonylcarbamoyl transferase component Bud32
MATKRDPDDTAEPDHPTVETGPISTPSDGQDEASTFNSSAGPDARTAAPRSDGQYLGMRLKDRYLIERELGRGAIGVVYLARDQQLLERRVVIKVLREGMDENIWVQKKFRQEIEALARIDHPGVVGVLDAGQTLDGRPYLVMQFVEGVSLRSVLTEQGLDPARVARLMRQIGHALGAAHEKGICHRDLKPENIMLQSLGEDEEQVKLIDFGIATVKDSQVEASSYATKVAGTPPYMAPEQLKGTPSAASDIYTLGVIAYEMLVGRKPFEADSMVALYEQQQAGFKPRTGDYRPGVTLAALQVITRALSFDPRDRYPRARDFSEELSRALTTSAEKAAPVAIGTAEGSVASVVLTTAPFEADADAVQSATCPLRVALLYKRNVHPDEQLLKLLEIELTARGHEVFVDRHLAVGVEWAKEIERQLRTSDVVIPLLSAGSVSSEMLAYEVQIAHEAAQRQGKPRLLPVRVNYDGPLPDPLSSILDPIQYALWQSQQDSWRLITQLLQAMLEAPPAQPAVRPRKLEPVGGAVPLDSEFYIVRPTDEEFRTAIGRRDSIVLVKGARQMGKTSLLARGLQQAREAGARVVLTDFQMLNASHLASVEPFFLALGELIADQLDLEVLPEEVWNPRRGPSVNFGRYIRREVLEKISAPVVWGLDEVDRLFTCDFGSEVFGLFRSWHNARSLDPQGPWQRLTLAIAYATEAHLFITDVNQSPFNVGTRLALEDFTLEQVAELNRRYGSPLKDEEELRRFFHLVSGQPYLVRRGLHELTTHEQKLDAFEAHADRDEGPFGDHLRRILVLLAQDAVLAEVVRGVLQGGPCPSAESFYRLRSAGVMAGDAAQEARPRCQLYATYLERHLCTASRQVQQP